LHREVVDAIGTSIVQGALRPGDVLPTEADLSGDLGVSRTVIREALRVLASKGLVETRPKTGTRVLPRARWQPMDPDVLRWQFAGDVEAPLYREILEIRSIIEPAAAGLAAARRTDEEAQEIMLLLERMELGVSDEIAYMEADIDFHAAILRATHNDLLGQMIATVANALEATRPITARVTGGRQREMPSHRAIAVAIQKGQSAKAIDAMSKCVAATTRDVESILRKEQ
jgi:GntR family transcriptional regulator, galactonate operon transcriptional repressor